MKKIIYAAIIILVFNYLNIYSQILPKLPRSDEVTIPKLEYRLDLLFRDFSSIKKIANEQLNYYKKKNILIMGDKVKIEVHVKNVTDVTRIDFNLFEIEKDDHYGVYQNIVQLLLPIKNLKILSEESYFLCIYIPKTPKPDVISEGVRKINADEFHDAGYTGDGVKIAIIDGGFTGYNDLLGTELPSNVVTKSFYNSTSGNGDITGDGEVHGTAVAEIVYDVAPDAQLYLINFNTLVDFSYAVDYADSQGVKIINHSMGWYGLPYDGTGEICNIARVAINNGILWVNSAGNEAKKHYEGYFKDTDYDYWHEFNDTHQTLEVKNVNIGDNIQILLSWDDWFDSSKDYDLYLYKDDGDFAVVDSSINRQTGSQNPTENINYTVEEDGIYYLTVHNFNATDSSKIEIFSFNHELDFIDEEVSYGSSIVDPASAEEVLAVGATWYVLNEIEDYSSRGPTNDGRIKPDIVAPADISNYTYSPYFAGTSASAPHVAGAAALLLEEDASMTNTDLKNLLESQTVDLGDVGKDNIYGNGILSLSLIPVYFTLSTVADQKVNVPFKIAVTPNWLGDTLIVLIGCNFNAIYPDGPQLFAPSVSDTFTITADEAKNDAVISVYKASDYTLLGRSNTFNISSLASSDIGPPSNLSAVDNPNDAGGYIKLSFTASANHPGYTSLSGYNGDNIPIDYYQVYRNSTDTSFANAINWAVIPATPKAPGQSNTITAVISTKGDESGNAFYWAAAVKGELPPSVTEGVSKASAVSKTSAYLVETKNASEDLISGKITISDIIGHNRAIGAKNNPNLTADFDSDQKVGLRDFAVLNWAYDNPDEYDRLFDLNFDGSINDADFKIFENQFGGSISNNTQIAYQSGSNGNSMFELVNEYDPDNKVIKLQVIGKNVVSLAGYSFKLNYNQKIYEFVSVNDGGFLESNDGTARYFLNHTGNNGTSIVSNVLESNDRCPDGEGVLAVFTLRHISEQIEPLTVENIEIMDKNYQLNSFYKLSLDCPVPVPKEFDLKNNYPNPFNPVTTIKYELPEASLVTLKVYNKLGQMVRTLVDEEKPAGYYSVQWDGENDYGVKVSSGIYFYSIVTNAGYVKVKKMVFLK